MSRSFDAGKELELAKEILPVSIAFDEVSIHLLNNRLLWCLIGATGNIIHIQRQRFVVPVESLVAVSATHSVNVEFCVLAL